jgi:hypothetical protein
MMIRDHHHNQVVTRHLIERQHNVLDRAFQEAYFGDTIAHLWLRRISSDLTRGA